MIPLDGMAVQVATHKKFEHYFELVGKEDVFHFAAESLQDLQDWTSTIECVPRRAAST